MNVLATIDALIAAEHRRHHEALASLQRLKDELAAESAIPSVAEWLSYSDLARLWDTSKDGAKSRVKRLGPMPRRMIKGRAHVARTALAGKLPSDPIAPGLRPGRPRDGSGSIGQDRAIVARSISNHV